MDNDRLEKMIAETPKGVDGAQVQQLIGAAVASLEIRMNAKLDAILKELKKQNKEK